MYHYIYIWYRYNMLYVYSMYTYIYIFDEWDLRNLGTYTFWIWRFEVPFRFAEGW